MRKTNIRIIARRAIVMALLLDTTGCVYSYYEVHVKNGQTTTDRILSCDKENGVLDVVRLDAKRTIFYPEDFEYVHRYSDGDNWHLWKEALCRLPTVLIEVPFYFLNRRGEDVPISSEMLGIADASVVNNLLCCYVPWGLLDAETTCIAITNKLGCVGTDVATMCVEWRNACSMDKTGHPFPKMTYRCTATGKSFDVSMPDGLLCDWIYFADKYECYALREVKLETCSFCGIMINGKELIPFLWRIDIKTGNSEPVAWLDKGKVTYATRKTKIK